MTTDTVSAFTEKASLAATLEPRKPRKRRSESYWEPIFAPEDKDNFPTAAWDFKDDRGRPYHSTFTAEGLQAAVEAKLKPIFGPRTFQKCDFEGVFGTKNIVFKQVEFIECDFGLSSWSGAKFTECNFNRCSFSQSTFQQCEFRGCTWNEIGISGNATLIPGTIITNPDKFIAAAYTNLDKLILKDKGRSPLVQRMRLERTKATLARVIVGNLSQSGEEKSYYSAIKTATNHALLANAIEAEYECTNAKNAFGKCWLKFLRRLYLIERSILNSAGAINCWGESLGRPAALGLGTIVVFALIYRVSGIRPTIFSATMASIDVTLLVGYTKHTARGIARWHQFAFAVNMLVGLAWYAVFVPTVMNRISRVR